MICLLAIGAAAGIIYPQVRAASHWWQAQRAIEDDDLESAKNHLQECLKAWPHSAETHFLMARTCRRTGDFDLARHYLKEAKQFNWLPEQIQLEYLLMQAQAGIVRPAEPKLRQALFAGKGDETLIFEALVVGCLQDNLLDEAHQWVTDWIQNFPGDWRGHFWKGKILEAGLRFDEAGEEYRQVLDIKPDHAESRLRRGEMLLKRGRHAEALPYFESFLEREPDNSAGLLGLARCQRSLEPPAVARATVDRLLADHPDFAPGLLLRGQLELDVGNPEEALSWLQQAEKQLPFDLEVNQNLAAALRLLKQDTEAVNLERRREKIAQDYRRMEELTKEIIQHPRDVSLRYEAGSILIGLGNLREGARWLFSALLIDSTHQPTLKLLTQSLDKLGDPQLAEAYRRILQETKSRESPASLLRQ